MYIMLYLSDTDITPEQHIASMVEQLVELSSSDLFCDVEIIAEDSIHRKRGRFRGYKNLLSAGNQYFRDFFRESPDVDRVVIPVSISTESLHMVIIRHIYEHISEYNDDDITEENAYELLIIGHALYLDVLVRQVTNFIIGILSRYNVLQYHEHAVSSQNDDLITATTFIIKRDFMILWEQFHKLSINALLYICESDQINIDCEDTVFKCVVNWIEEHSYNEYEYKPLVDAIRFEHLSSSCKSSVLDPSWIEYNKYGEREERYWPYRQWAQLSDFFGKDDGYTSDEGYSQYSDDFEEESDLSENDVPINDDDSYDQSLKQSEKQLLTLTKELKNVLPNSSETQVTVFIY